MMKWRSIACVAALAATVLGLGGAPAAPQKLKVLVVTGHDVLPAHDWRKTTEKIRAILEEGDRFEVRVVEDTGIFEASTLANYDVIVNNFGFWTAPELSPAAKAGLLRYVDGGKGLVSMHFACSSYQEWPEYKDLIGRVWVKNVGGHGPRGKFTAKIEKPEHPIVAGLSDFEIDDELYAKLTGDAKIDVLVSAFSADFSKKQEPLVFTKPYGKGRVVQNLFGHDVKVTENAAYRTLLKRCVEWAATGTVTVK